MNNLQAAKVLDRIFSNMNKNYNNKSCVAIDGTWGIGKTYFIQNYFLEIENKYEFIYISVFGKNSVRDIEKSILIHLLPGLKKINEDSGFTKAAKILINDMSDKFLGINIDNYINSFSIEDAKWNTIGNKRVIICLDDIERKSDSIEMKNLLGLIERTKENFDVLMIGNLLELNEKDTELFDKYKEKVIDNVIKIDEIDKNTLNCILKSMNEENRNEIIDIYVDGNVAFGKANPPKKSFLKSRIHNLRIFVKYVELIIRLEKYLEPYKVDEDIFKMCKAVIYDYYFPDKDEKKYSMNFDKFNIYKTINKILLNEEVEKDDFQEYFVANSEIREDISNIYNAYKFSESELTDLIKKIKRKIENKNLEYFMKQENVISLIDALNELEVVDREMQEELLEIAIDLYLPEKEKYHTKIDYSQWNDIDNYGCELECDKKIQQFIEIVNQKCIEKFNNFVNDKIEEAKKTKNYEELMMLYNFSEMDRIEDFEEIFDYYFNQLVMNFSDKVYQKINTLIDKTKTDIICNFFTDRIKNETQITKIKRYERFDMQLEIKIQYEDQEEYNRNNPTQEIY